MAETLGPDARFIRPDLKGEASAVFTNLFESTAKNFPEKQFQATIIRGKSVIFPAPYGVVDNTDGTGTKAEIHERLAEQYNDPNEFEDLAFDVCGMIEGDSARDGLFLLSISESIDVNSAHPETMKALARGLEKAAATGQFAITSGEVAELDYRSAGHGKFHVNWNAMGKSLYVPEKALTGEKLKPGQPLVGFREPSLRSNGYSSARDFMVNYFLFEGGGIAMMAGSVLPFYADTVKQYGLEDHKGRQIVENWSSAMIKEKLDHKEDIPWHLAYPQIARDLKHPSRFYSPIMYDAQGGVFGEPKVKMTGGAHITGGGIPLKGYRLVKEMGLGVSVDPVFPDPDALSAMLKLSSSARNTRFKIDDMDACENWNRGIGFLVAVENTEEAKKMIDIAEQHDCEAEIAGELIDKKEIQFRGHTWYY